MINEVEVVCLGNAVLVTIEGDGIIRRAERFTGVEDLLKNVEERCFQFGQHVPETAAKRISSPGNELLIARIHELVSQLSRHPTTKHRHGDGRLLEDLGETTSGDLQLRVGLLELRGNRLRFLILLLDLDRLFLQLIAELLQLTVSSLRFCVRCLFSGEATSLLFSGPALREISGDFGEANELARLVAERRDDDVRPELRSVFADTPALILEATQAGRHLELVLGKALGRFVEGVE